MATFPFNKPLEAGMKENPIVHAQLIKLEESFFYPSDEQLSHIFTTGKAQLKTWGRDGNLEKSPHWIGTRGGTPLHTDKAYPRYTHQLKLRVDDDIFCRGYNKQGLKLVRGLFYVLDTHSPHQILCTGDKLAYNVSVSIDSNEVLDFNWCIAECMNYANTKPFIAKIHK